MSIVLALWPGHEPVVDLRCGTHPVQAMYLLRRLFSEYPDEVQNCFRMSNVLPNDASPPATLIITVITANIGLFKICYEKPFIHSLVTHQVMIDLINRSSWCVLERTKAVKKGEKPEEVWIVDWKDTRVVANLTEKRIPQDGLDWKQLVFQAHTIIGATLELLHAYPEVISQLEGHCNRYTKSHHVPGTTINFYPVPLSIILKSNLVMMVDFAVQRKSETLITLLLQLASLFGISHESFETHYANPEPKTGIIRSAYCQTAAKLGLPHLDDETILLTKVCHQLAFDELLRSV